MKEIEYKFLVDKSIWALQDKGTPIKIAQGFLYNTKEKTIRVRIKNEKGFLTIKGETIGLTREEFEYEIPYDDAYKILESLDKKIIKDRYEIEFDGRIWEVDVFSGKLEGLILAEIEVDSEEDLFSKPEWIGKDVSMDPQYYNAVLINR